jgi:hypothetical protein
MSVIKTVLKTSVAVSLLVTIMTAGTMLYYPQNFIKT